MTLVCLPGLDWLLCLGRIVLNVLQAPFCSLTTHYWLKLGWWGWLMRMRFTWKNSQKTIDTSHFCHCWELQTRKRTGSSIPGGSWEGWNPLSDTLPAIGRHLPGLWVDGNIYILIQCLVYIKSLHLQVVDMSSLVHAALVLYTTIVN